MGKEGENVKGQITMFVIVAMVLLFIFSFLIFVSSSLQKNQLDSQAEKQIQQYIDQNTVNLYVTSCLDIVVNQAILAVSMQGGVENFTNMTRGIDYIERFDPELNRSFNISVAIKPQYDCPIVSTVPPDYPYPKRRLLPGADLAAIYSGPGTCKYSANDSYLFSSGFFGYNQLKRLCSWNGTNKLNSTDTQYGFLTCSPLVYTSSNNTRTSVQEELALWIEKDIQKCVDLTKLPISSNITIDDEPKAKITFGSEGMYVGLIYPFRVKIGNKQPVTKLVDFSITKSVPLKEFYDYIFTSVTLDVTYVNFDMVNNITGDPQLIYYYKGYEVELIKDVMNHTDIVRFIYPDVIIDNHSLTYQIGIKNRRPALEYIHFVSGIDDVDVFIGENDSVGLAPRGYDPDGDWLIYNYSGWKEDYDEVYDETLSGCSTAVTMDEISQYCMVKTYSHPQNWTKSDAFVLTKQNATYTVTPEDRGVHHVTISVWEGERQKLVDFQKITIYVFSSPEAKAEGYNLYPDIPDNYASLEDPYFLSGITSTVGMSSSVSPNNFTYFQWKDTLLTDLIFLVREGIDTDDNKTLSIPEEINGTFDIGNIKSFIWTSGQTGRHNVTLTINTTLGLSDDDMIHVDVVSCFSHTNPFNVFSYPYNNNPFNVNDSLFANHACCVGTNYVGTNVACYENTLYGSIWNFTDNYFWNREPVPPAIQNIRYGLNSYPGDPPRRIFTHDNDIFMREFERNCSGDRGNACTGVAVEIRTVVDNCNDNNFGSSPNRQDERCSGPSFHYALVRVPPYNHYRQIRVFDTNTLPMQCINYQSGYSYGITFELIANSTHPGSYPNADGRCNTNKECGNNYLTSKAMCNYGCTSTGTFAGQCNTPIYGDCICNASCGSPPSAPLCVGLAINNQPDLARCDLVGQTYLGDTCYYCGYSDSNICKSAPAQGCTANPTCNNIQRNTAVISNNYQYCNNVCQPLSCAPYSFNRTSNTCNTYGCTFDDSCATGLGYQCCTVDRYKDGLCNAYGMGDCFISNLIIDQ